MNKILTLASDRRQKSSGRELRAAALLSACMASACIHLQNPFKRLSEPPPAPYAVQTDRLPEAEKIENSKCLPEGPGLTFRMLDSGIKQKVLVTVSKYEDCTDSGYRKATMVTGTVSRLVSFHGQPVLEMEGQARLKISNAGVREPPPVSPSKLMDMAKGRKVVVIGDIHTDTKDDMLLIKLIPGFYSAGFNQLGLEFPESWQPLAGSYQSASDPEQALTELISELFAKAMIPVDRLLIAQVAAAHDNGMGVSFFDDTEISESAIHLDASDVAPAFSRHRTDVLLQNISGIVDAGGRVVVYTGFIHAVNSKRITVRVSEHDDGDFIEAGPSLGYLLKKKYGDSQVLITSLSGCISSFLDVCVKGTPGTEQAPEALPGPRK